MPTFRHGVSPAQRDRSCWFAEIACYVTPEGLAWRYSDDSERLGVSWRDAAGEPIAVARQAGWLDEGELELFWSRERPRHGTDFDPERE